MKNLRTIVGLVVLALLAVAAHLAVDFSERKAFASFARSSTVLPLADAATRLIFEYSDSPRVVLANLQSWRFMEPFAGQADSSAVRRILDALAFTAAEDALSDAEILKLGRTRADFGLEYPGLRVVVGRDGERAAVVFGDRTATGESVYAAREGVEAVFTVPTGIVAALEMPIKRLRDAALFPFPAAAVTAFDLKRGTGDFSRFQRRREDWQLVEPEKMSASRARVEGFLQAVTAFPIADFVWPAGTTNEAAVATDSLLAGYGLDPESSVTVTLRTAAGAATVSLGLPAGEGLVYALIRGGTEIVTVDQRVRAAAATESVALTDSRLFPFAEEKLSSLQLADGETTYLLSRAADGWVLESPVAAKAEAPVVGELLGRVLALTAAQLDEGSSLRLGVVSNAELVAVSRAAVLGDLKLADLRSREILHIEPREVRRLSRPAADGKGGAITVVFDPELSSWSVEHSVSNQTVKAEAVEGILAQLNPLKAVAVVSLRVKAAELGNYGLEKPRLTLAVDRQKAESVRKNILIGAAAPGGGHYATVGASEAVFVLDEATVKKLSEPLVE